MVVGFFKIERRGATCFGGGVVGDVCTYGGGETGSGKLDGGVVGCTVVVFGVGGVVG